MSLPDPGYAHALLRETPHRVCRFAERGVRVVPLGNGCGAGSLVSDVGAIATSSSAISGPGTWGDSPGTSPREGATFAAPSRHALDNARQTLDNARQTLGPVGVREMSSTIWAKSFSLPSIAMSACARTPTSVLSSSTTGKRRT